MQAFFSCTKDRSIIVNTTSTLVLPARQNRVFARLTNDSNEAIYLMLGETARMNTAMRLNPAGTTRDFWETNATNLYNGAIYAICASGNKNLLILEDSPSQSSSSCSSSSSSCSSSFSSSSSSFSSSCSSSFSSSSSSLSYSSSSSRSFSSSSSSFSSSSSSSMSSSCSSCSSSFSSSSRSSSSSSSAP